MMRFKSMADFGTASVQPAPMVLMEFNIVLNDGTQTFAETVELVADTQPVILCTKQGQRIAYLASQVKSITWGSP